MERTHIKNENKHNVATHDDIVDTWIVICLHFWSYRSNRFYHL
jgi:hypothetical protein